MRVCANLCLLGECSGICASKTVRSGVPFRTLPSADTLRVNPAILPFFQKKMPWSQTLVELRARPAGFHLVTPEIEAALGEEPRLRVGLVNLFLQHTSASLTINENADP